MKTGFTREVHYPAPGSSPLLRSSKSVRHIVRQAVRPARVQCIGRDGYGDLTPRRYHRGYRHHAVTVIYAPGFDLAAYDYSVSEDASIRDSVVFVSPVGRREKCFEAIGTPQLARRPSTAGGGPSRRRALTPPCLPKCVGFSCCPEPGVRPGVSPKPATGEPDGAPLCPGAESPEPSMCAAFLSFRPCPVRHQPRLYRSWPQIGSPRLLSIQAHPTPPPRVS